MVVDFGKYIVVLFTKSFRSSLAKDLLYPKYCLPVYIRGILVDTHSDSHTGLPPLILSPELS